eukprot:scaffold62827_cov64-Cyclotella_meneghiniana.AAC.2
MPSRKKAKGKARKAKKQAAENDLHTGTAAGSSCRHLADHCPPDDLNLCLNLVKEIDTEVITERLEARGRKKFGSIELLLIVSEIYEVLLRSGRDPSSLQMATKMPLALPYLFMLVHMEVVERFNGVIHSIHDEYDMFLKTHQELYDLNMIACPREVVRYFHRLNSCSCLKEIYYHLKDNTKRTTYCSKCKKIKDIREMMVCSKCKVANYCSNECAIDDYAHHKTNCKHRER